MNSELLKELNEVFPNNPTKIKAINQNVKLAEVLLYPARTEWMAKICEDLLNSLLAQ